MPMARAFCASIASGVSTSAAHGHHQVGQLVDDHDDVRQDARLVRRAPRTPTFGVRCGFEHAATPSRHLLVEVLDVARAVGREELVAVLHLDHGPLEHRRGVAVVGDDLVAQVRQRVVHRELDHLRVDHQEAQRLGRVAVDQRVMMRVHADRLARAGGARDQQVRHLGQVADDRPPLEVAAERDGERARRALVVLALDHLAEVDDLRGGVRHFDAHRAPPRNRRDDADRRGAHGEREVVGEVGELADLHAGRRLDLVLRDHGARGAAHELAVHLEGPQRLHELLAHSVQVRAALLDVARGRRREQLGRRQFVGIRVERIGAGVDGGGHG